MISLRLEAFLFACAHLRINKNIYYQQEKALTAMVTDKSDRQLLVPE